MTKSFLAAATALALCLSSPTWAQTTAGPTDTGGSASSIAAIATLKAQGMETKVERNLEGPAKPVGQKRVEIFTYTPTPAELPGVTGYLMRSSVVEVEAGGIVPVHTHAGRPAILEVLEGEIVQHRSDGTSFAMRPGSITVGSDSVAHWWQNTSAAPTRIWVVDLCEAGVDDMCEPGMTTDAVLQPVLTNTVANPPSGPKLTMDEEIAIDLAGEFPGAAGNRIMRARTVTFAPGAIAPVHAHDGRPNYIRVLQGTLTMHTYEGDRQLVPGDVVLESGPGMRAFSNAGPGPVLLRAIDVYDPAMTANKDEM